jgi:hypothetical protein
VNPGFDTNRAKRLCSSSSSSARGTPAVPWPRGSDRSASVIGEPQSRKIGATIDSTMCCAMCTLNTTMP